MRRCLRWRPILAAVIGVLLFGGVVLPALVPTTEYVACGTRRYRFRGRVVNARTQQLVAEARVEITGVEPQEGLRGYPGELFLRKQDGALFEGTDQDGAFDFQWEQRFCRSGRTDACGTRHTINPGRARVDVFTLTATATGFQPGTLQVRRSEKSAREYLMSDLVIRLEPTGDSPAVPVDCKEE